MRYKIKLDVVTERRGLFGRRRKVVEKKTVYVDRKTYKAWKKEQERQRTREKNRELRWVDDLIFLDCIFDDD